MNGKPILAHNDFAMKGKSMRKGIIALMSMMSVLIGVELEVRSTTIGDVGDTKQMRVSYIKGTEIKQGRSAVYDEDGHLLEQSHYINGRKEGREMKYSAEGDVLLDANYKNNKLEGLAQEFYPQNILKSEITYSEGKIIGKAKWYHENGALAKEADYIDGMPEGKVIEYYDNGKASRQYTYKQGKIEGVSKGFFKNGKIAELVTYRDGLKNGDMKQYDENGIVRLEASFENDEKVGRERTFDSVGKMTSQRVYGTGTPKKVEVSWFYPNGKLKLEMLYENNQAIWQKEYNENGEITSKLDCQAQNCLPGLSGANAGAN